jgi:hypothetical protein
MAKKLVYNYTFDASAQTVKISGLYTLRTLLLITNVTDNIIIFNFASPTAGGSVSYDSANDETTITLDYDTTSMSDGDELQIFTDDGEDLKIDGGESLLDPVHKFRVSTPQNLIDTDFEYGLQPTKWETIELVDNIPSVYTRGSGVSIGGISQVNTIQNSETITVICTIDHELSIGDPIEIQGTSSRTANGKYIVTTVPSTTIFSYKASAVQSSTANIKTAYTTIIPGSFFSGSDIKYDTNRGIETDNALPSTLTVETDYVHGLSTSTSLYITNTVGKKTFTISDPSATAADGSPGINTSDSSLYIQDHDLFTNQRIFIYPTGAGVLPTLDTSATEPTGTEAINSTFNAVNTACDSIKSTMGSAHMPIFMSGGTANAAYYTTNSSVNLTGGIQQFTYGHYANNGFSYFIVQGPSGNNYGYYRARFNGFGVNSLYTGSPVDVGQIYGRYAYYGPNTLSGLFYWQSTQYNATQLTDYIVTVKQIQNPASIVPGADRIQFYDESYQTKWNSYYYYAFYHQIYSSNTRTNYSGDWYYTWNSVELNPPNAYDANRTGFFKLTINLENDSWAGQYGTNSSWQNLTYYSAYSLEARQLAYKGARYEIEVLFQYDAGTNHNDFGATSGTVATFSSMVNTIVGSVVTQLQGAQAWPGGATGINTIRAIVQDDDRITLKTDSDVLFKFSNTGTGPINVETGAVVGAVDNYYNVSGVGSTSITITAQTQLNPRQLDFTNSEIITSNSEYYIYIADGHTLRDGQKVIFNLVSGSAPGGLSDGVQYYAKVADDKHFFLSSSIENWNTSINAITSVGSGSFNVEVFSISGRIAGIGNVSLSESSKVVTGTGTKFQSTYKIGDTFSVVSSGATVNSFVESTIESIVSDTSLTLDNIIGITTDSTNHYVDTKINVRADGQFLHRPFDGGVDITAGTSPDSTIVRQTRKYFRYQSGKGIQCSMAINFNPARPVRLAQGSGTSVTMTTEYPHGLTVGDDVKISGASDSAYNGTFEVTGSTDFTFSYTSSSSVSEANPTGFIDYAIQGYTNAGIRAGLFDFQNGFFFEYDGTNLYAVRRSSVQQCSGTASVVRGSNIVLGENTRFQDQFDVGDKVVIRGQTYKITSVPNQTELNIQPYYRGSSNNGVVLTKTVDVKVPQSQWNIDKADGTGPSGYILDINKIQMVYLDYSWYGAGKIRFGFKDTYGHVKYMHEFIHNNRLNEAYMRSGNIPARYEAFNSGIPSYVPSLFHWGTSVIMDGGFDDDDSYLFTASGNTLTFTNGDVDTATTTGDSVLTSTGSRFRNYYVRIPFATADASKFSTGISLYTSGGELDGETVAFTSYGSSVFYVYIYIGSGYVAPAVYPSVSNATAVSIGAPSAGTSDVDLTDLIPLISIRLAPSADNNLIGELGERDIINRMQLKLKELGVSISHDARITVVLNGSLDNLTYSNVGTPSLSQYIAHGPGDTINGGTVIYQFRASGGATDSTGKRLVSSNAFDLSQLIDLGNSILGGDGVFPNGPDIITICATVINTAEIDSASSFQVSSRLSWAESQA